MADIRAVSACVRRQGRRGKGGPPCHRFAQGFQGGPGYPRPRKPCRVVQGFPEGYSVPLEVYGFLGWYGIS